MKKWIAALVAATMMATPVYAQDTIADDELSVEGYLAGGNSVIQMAKEDGKTQKLDAKVSTDWYEVQLTDLYIENFSAHVLAEVTPKDADFDPDKGYNISCWLSVSPDRAELERQIQAAQEADVLNGTQEAASMLAAAETSQSNQERLTDDEVMNQLKTGINDSGMTGSTSRLEGSKVTSEVTVNLQEEVPEKLYAMVSGIYISKMDSCTIDVLKSGELDVASEVEVIQRGAEVTIRLKYTAQDMYSNYQYNSYYPTSLKLASGMRAEPIDNDGYSDDTHLILEYVYKLPAGEESLAGAELTWMGFNTEHYETPSDKTEIFEIAVDASKVVSGADFEVMTQEIKSMDGTVVFDTIQFNPYIMRLAYFIKGEGGFENHYDEATDTYYPLIRVTQDGKDLETISGTGTYMDDYHIGYYIEDYIGVDQKEPIEIMVLKPDKTYETFTWTSVMK